MASEYFEIRIVIVNADAVRAFDLALQIANELADAQPYSSDLQELRALLERAAEGLVDDFDAREET